jgi:ATP-dependent Lon protease
VRNKKDLADIPKYIKKDMEFVLAETMDDVLKNALGKTRRPVRKKKAAAARKAPKRAKRRR